MSKLEDFPEPPVELIEQSDNWAFDRNLEGMREQLGNITREAYYRCVVLYQHHREALLQRIEASGGPVRTEYRNLSGLMPFVPSNRLICRDGTVIGLDELTTLSPIKTELEVPYGLPDGVTRTYEIQPSFGGSYIGNNAERVFGLEYEWLRGAEPFDVFLKDTTYFPEDIGITGRVITSFNEPFDPGKFRDDARTLSESFSLDGKIWRPSLIFDEEIFPDPHRDPVGYRRWALTGDAKLEVTFQAPAVNIDREGRRHKGMKTVIDKHGSIITSSSELKSRDVLEKFQRFLNLLDLYYREYVPPEKREAAEEEIAALLNPKAELSATLELTSGSD